MQALKKAEQSKQQLTEVPISAEGSVFGAQPHESTSKVSTNSSLEAPVVPHGEPSSFELSLTPHLELESASPDCVVDFEGNVNQEAPLYSVLEGRLDSDLKDSTPDVSDFNIGDQSSFHTSAVSREIDEEKITQRLSGDAARVGQFDSSGDASKLSDENKNMTESIPNGRLPQDFLQAKAETVKETELVQQKAKAVFAANATNKSRVWRWVAILVLSVIIVILGVAYFYLEMMNSTKSPVSTTPAVVHTDSLPSQPEQNMPSEVLTPKVMVEATNTPLEASIDANDRPAAVNASRVEKKAEDSDLTKRRNSSFMAPESAANPVHGNRLKLNAAGEKGELVDVGGSSLEGKSIQIQTSNATPSLHPNLNQAYQALSSDDLNTADVQYQRVLKDEPNNRDALLGLATISVRRGQTESAVATYLRLLELDPTDTDAIAGLVSLQQGDLTQVESRLKKALIQFPNASGIHFVLGNVYAQQSRWAEAQQMYFRAFSSSPTNPDYAFNLAVSLDRLNQVKLAREYYQRALALTQTSTGNFSKLDVRKRVQALDELIKE